MVRKDLTTELQQNAVVPTDVHRNQAELITSTIKDKGSHKVIDKITVTLNGKDGFHEVEFTNLGINKVSIDDSNVKRYPKLLVGGLWAITDVEGLHRFGRRAARRSQVQPLADRRRRPR